MGRPVTVSRRRVVDAIFYVAATGCQWRALPEVYPNWNTMHRYHLTWSRDGTWERIAVRLAAAVREREGREAEPSAGIVDARTVRGAATVTSPTRGYDAGKKISGRKTFGIVDTLGLLMAVTVVAANTSDNTGGITVSDRARTRSQRFRKLWCDAGFKQTFLRHCRIHHLAVTVVNRIHSHTFVAFPQRWIVEDDAQVGGIRTNVDFTIDPSSVQVRRLFSFGSDFIDEERALFGDASGVTLTWLLPDSNQPTLDQTTLDALTELTPGETVTAADVYTVPAPAPRDAAETDAGYLARLLNLDGTGLVSSAFGLATGGVGQLVATVAVAASTEQVPVVSIETVGSIDIPAGATNSYELPLANLGSVDATGLDVTASADSDPLPVTNVPATLAAGENQTAITSYTADSLRRGARGGLG